MNGKKNRVIQKIISTASSRNAVHIKLIMNIFNVSKIWSVISTVRCHSKKFRSKASSKGKRWNVSVVFRLVNLIRWNKCVEHLEKLKKLNLLFIFHFSGDTFFGYTAYKIMLFDISRVMEIDKDRLGESSFILFVNFF